MTTKFRKLKEQLSNLEDGDLISERRIAGRKGMLSKLGIYSPNWFRYLLFTVFLGTFLFYMGIQYTGSSANADSSTAPISLIEQFSTWINQPDEELLEGMGTWMEEMGYTGLTKEQLIELRRQGVTATYTSKMQDLGYTALSLDKLVDLRQNDVSATFSAMMKELGYSLTIEDLIQLRQHGVTAFYTSNMQDLGYTNLTKDELIRLKDTGVRTSEVKRLIEDQGTQPSVEELIRYHISNQ